MVKKARNRLDSPRGRKPHVRPSEVFGSANHYRGIFGREGLWDQLYPVLRDAKREQDVQHAFDTIHVGDSHYFVPSLLGLILTVVSDRAFPKTKSAQIAFFADSLAGRGDVTPRRSRDICEKERAKAKKAIHPHHIIRYEFYVECSCGYTGASQDHACARCRAPIQFEWDWWRV